MTSKTSDQPLLKEIRERYTYLADAWREAREERATDLRYIAGDPWEKEDREARKDAGRPCISHDELGQYVNAAVNNVRQNTRGIKIEAGDGKATEATAELRQGLIRRIETKSHAPYIYASAFQAMVEGGYAYLRVGRKYVSNDSFNQKIVIAPIANPDSVLFDWDCKEPDWSDGKDCFVLDPMPKAEFLRKFPRAEVRDFSPEDLRVAKDWIQDNQILLAEYWRIESEHSMLYLLANDEIVSELPRGVKPVRSRRVETKKLIQYLTNGVEILERTEQPGETLPIIPFIGLQRYMDEGGGSKRKIFSLVRLARDPQMSLAYLCSQQMEEAGLTPKTPYKGYKGQFESDKEAWDTINKIPHSYVQADPIVDAATGQVLPLPQRETFTPNFAAYEVSKDSCRRAVQAAMGVNPLPTAAQRDNQKSGIAIEHMQTQQEIGSFHFMSAFESGLELAGRVMNDWIPVTYDTEREEAIRKPDDSHRIVRLNTAAPYPDPKTGELQHFPIGEGDHDVVISTGPSELSQRDAVADFLDSLISNLGALPIPPPAAAKLLALAIQMRNLGPKGDEMAEIVAPADGGNQAQAQLVEAQQQTAAMQQALQEMQAELQQLKLEKAGKVIDNQFKLQLEKMREENALAIAEVSTKAQQISERLETFRDMMQQFHSQAHELGMTQQEHANTLDQQQQQAALQPPPQQGQPQQPQAA